MAFFVNKTSLSRLHVSSQAPKLSRREIHTQAGAREKALLAEDPALRIFKSYKKDVQLIRKIGAVGTVVVVAGCCYEIYVKATARQAGDAY